MVALLCAAGVAYAQPPAIFQGAIANSASGMHPTLAGGAIARGALFTIRGLRFGADAQGLTLQIAQGTKAVKTPILRLQSPAANSQIIEARMPVDAPLGTAQLTVIRGEDQSRPFTLEIAAASFGIYSEASKDWGPGRIYSESRGQRRMVTLAQPAHPGDHLILVGTGLGDETHPEIMVGGVPAVFQGRVSKDGTDEIAFTPSAKAPKGCSVPVYVRVHQNLVSNFVTLALSAGPGPCKDSLAWPVPASMPGQRGGAVVLSETRFDMRLANGARNLFTTDDGAAAFLRADPGDQFVATLHPLPPPGTCASYTRAFDSKLVVSSTLPAFIIGRLSGGPLNAGPAIVVEGANGARRMVPGPKEVGFYGADLGGSKPSSRVKQPLFLGPGDLHISSQGGPDVGPFSVTLRAGSSFEWTNRDELSSVDRSRGVTLTWRGLEPGRMMGAVALNVDQDTAAMGMSFCLAAPGKTSITFPPPLLSNVPASRPAPGVPYNALALASLPVKPEPIRAEKLDAGYAVFMYLDAKTVEFK